MIAPFMTPAQITRLSLKAGFMLTEAQMVIECRGIAQWFRK